MIKFYLEKILRTLKRHGIKITALKSINRANSIYKRYKLKNTRDSDQWSRLKNKFEGKRVFLIGNGPSLNKTPLYLLKNEYTMCFNRFFIIDERINWQPYFYTTTDNVVLSDIVEEVKEVIPKTSYSFFPDIHFRGDNFYDRIGQFENLFWLQQLHGEGFSKELPKIFPGGSVIYEGLQILNFLGFNKIYLIGVDLNYQVHKTAKYLKNKGLDIESQKDDDPNHFDPRYFGKNRKYHQPKDYVIQNVFRNLEYVSGLLPELNIKIINAGYDSKLDYFPRVDFHKVFNLSDESIETLFFECLSKNSDYESIFQFESENDKINSIDNFQPSKENDFYMDLENALKIMNKAVFTHIPIGPYNNKYYFIKRQQLSLECSPETKS
ncbi:MAG: DUF115 domain-containing protein [Planctomycetes bacterium]|nr:DUF115 domain-containing protein [Planctomycetota bacterium]